MLIYLADLAHNYLRGSHTVPLNIAYLAAYAKTQFGDKIEVRLFKYANELLDALDEKQPDLIGLSNYTWNYRLNAFVGGYIKQNWPQVSVVMGGPNIRLDRAGITQFLKQNNYVDIYCLLEGEIPLAEIIAALIDKKSAGSSVKYLKNAKINSCFSLVAGKLAGRHQPNNELNLDYIPSPYLSGILDSFLKENLIPLLETNRGCPYSCAYCSWGVSAHNKLKQFGLARVKSEMDYIAGQKFFPYWIIADANFGILERDIDIAKHLDYLHKNKKPFTHLEIWWDKSARDNMVEIAKLLKGLSSAYIAFQTFDPVVLSLIGRRNISLERLKDISCSLSKYSERLHTDILLGLPGETMDSHLNSLNTAFNYGFNSIGGGEVRLLMGSELESASARKKYNLKTKYRLVQEGFGIYRGQLVFDLEESIRATKWISEKEMLKLRSIRAVFYGSISVGEFLPLIEYLKQCGVRVTDFFKKLVEVTNSNGQLTNESIDWLSRKAAGEWFNTPADAERFFSQPVNRAELLNNPTIKLNFDFVSSLMLSGKKYQDFCRYILAIITRYFPQCDAKIAQELLALCAKRNYIMRCLAGQYKTSDSIKLSPKTIKVLEIAGFLPKQKDRRGVGPIGLKINERDAKFISSYLKEKRGQLNIQKISILIETVSNFHLKLAR